MVSWMTTAQENRLITKRPGSQGARKIVEGLLARLDIRPDGGRPWDIRVHHSNFYRRILAGGSLALGESYMDAWWDCQALDRFFDKILSAGLDRQAARNWKVLWSILRAKIFNAQSRSRATAVAKRHYDVGNALFSQMLDRRMNYSCAIWEKGGTLDQAQENKMDLICRKIALKPGMAVLDIGCGWGGFARWAAEKYKVKVTGVTLSREQAAFARQYGSGLDVTIDLKDYRDLKGQFDAIASIGMFEHVGSRNYRTFMQVVHRCLKPGGLFLLQTIGGHTSVTGTDPWLNKYIFPNSMLPSARQIAIAAEGLLALEDWHNFGPHYDRTLMAWHRNFIDNWDKIKSMYDERFYRMWTYYLLACAGSFRSRQNQLWQILYSRIPQAQP